MDRREILKRVPVFLSGMITAGVLGAAGIAAALSPVLKGRRRETWREVGPLDDFPAGRMSEATVAAPRDRWAQRYLARGVYVWRPEEGEIVVFSGNCTDLSCPLHFDQGSECFFCPCHGGIFARDGQRMAGPPNRPLYRFANRLRDGVLEVDLDSLPPMT
jgi:menaquinol-cytochrome c reductase iron-sulfur subunit